MPMYELIRTQKIPASAAEVWALISSPANLKDITPPHMRLEITSAQLPDKIYPGLFICYNVRPLPGIRMKWVTEITQVKEPDYFVDEQRMGPYHTWHHQHFLAKIDGGILMTDKVHYRPPLGFIGGIANALFLEKQLSNLFDYRYIKIEERFGKF